MTQPELFDVVELMVDLPEQNLRSGMRGAIVEQYSESAYEVEFTNQDGETLVLATLSPEKFLVVWSAKTQKWLTIAEQVAAIVNRLSEEQRQAVLNFARSLSA